MFCTLFCKFYKSVQFFFQCRSTLKCAEDCPLPHINLIQSTAGLLRSQETWPSHFQKERDKRGREEKDDISWMLPKPHWYLRAMKSKFPVYKQSSSQTHPYIPPFFCSSPALQHTNSPVNHSHQISVPLTIPPLLLQGRKCSYV